MRRLVAALALGAALGLSAGAPAATAQYYDPNAGMSGYPGTGYPATGYATGGYVDPSMMYGGAYGGGMYGSPYGGAYGSPYGGMYGGAYGGMYGGYPGMGYGAPGYSSPAAPFGYIGGYPGVTSPYTYSQFPGYGPVPGGGFGQYASPIGSGVYNQTGYPTFGAFPYLALYGNVANPSLYNSYQPYAFFMGCSSTYSQSNFYVCR
jgi:hypothetical protein